MSQFSDIWCKHRKIFQATIHIKEVTPMIIKIEYLLQAYIELTYRYLSNNCASV